MSESERPGIGVLGVGKYIPQKVVTNEQLEAWTQMPAQTIVDKTGIVTRYIVEDGETASGMSAIAAKQAIEMAGVQADQIGLIIGCTFSGDYVYPAMACKVQDLIGARNAGAFDLMANCTAFQIGLGVASDRMSCDSDVAYGLVIGTALQSPFINWTDPDSAIYFGDGAGAAVLGRVPSGYGVLCTEMFTNARVFDAVRLRGGGSSYPLRPENINDGLQYYEINGMEVWKQVIQYQPKVIRRALEKIGEKIEDVDFFIFHQANLRLIEYLMGKMKQPMSKTYTNVAEIGNTADASLAITLCDAVRAGLIQRDQLVVISGVGAGFIFGATVIRWY
ncbi:3-oxoacyl-ACP synthase III family protein [Acidovorax sp.]|uniref:3-oxoacyl-ACP synthase III family protein n=1 Tax=Acidovorax sp. TaxID=1872122 RepID=UPI0025BE9EC2|nr:ketoacyl-ACP synthase III [Acidovorax sp.]MBL7091677.1 ketoacyl-ACP synthase III [Acidovorax sp.]